MPNWVFNTLVISGDSAELERLKSHVSKPFTANFLENCMEGDTWKVRQGSQSFSNPVFSFFNIITPTDLDAYYGEPYESNMGDASARATDSLKNGMDWYNWNIRNWGTKWDVAIQDGSSYSDTQLDEADGKLLYSFNTAWSPVHKVIDKLAADFPTLYFDYEYEEENGWGGQAVYQDGEMIIHREYDEPSSHSDYEERGRLGSCMCQWADEEDWFDDCPKTLDTDDQI